MHIAAYSGVPEVIELLGELGVDLFKRSVNGYIPKKLVNKPGIALKMIEKYEKKFIIDNIF